MSLVGTRPILPGELEQYELHHRTILHILRKSSKMRGKIYAPLFRRKDKDHRL